MNAFVHSMTGNARPQPAGPTTACIDRLVLPAREVGKLFEMPLGPQPAEMPAADVRTALATIVVGVDGSESAWNAYWWSRGEAKRLRGRIVAVFVSPGAGIGVVPT